MARALRSWKAFVCPALQLAACACARDVVAHTVDARPPVVASTAKIAVLAGPLYTPAPAQDDIGFYGTDLGVSFEHGGEVRILFGDTWADELGNLIGPSTDDAQGAISTLPEPEGFPDGDSVDAYVESHIDGSSEAFWAHAGPPLRFEVTAAGRVAAIELYRGGFAGQPPLDLGVGKAVMAAFSNARDGAFAIFRRDVAVACSGGTNPSCEAGFTCDTEMGFCSNSSPFYPKPCVFGSARCGQDASCMPASGGGLCQDRTSSMYKEGDEDGRTQSVVIEHEVGSADLELPTRYFTTRWLTNKFTNPLAKTVADFDPARADPEQNDYRPADGSRPSREKVLIWARPHAVGVKADGRDARLYFAYSDMPEYGPSGPIGWNPRYLCALEDGRPVFCGNPSDAIALDLGGDAVPESEPYDVVDRAAVSYIAELRQWVMFYGGDYPPVVLNEFVGPSFERVERDPMGSIKARFARHPWGPWSAPVPVFEAGDASVDPPRPGSEYASGGALYHYGCRDPDCIATAPARVFDETPYGFLYGANIFDGWTEVREQGTAVDIYWNVSTWNPYQVILLRTRIRR